MVLLLFSDLHYPQFFPKSKERRSARIKTVGQMMETIFRLRSTLPRQKVTYDLDIVLTFMDSLPDNKYLTMKWIQRIFLHSYVSLVDKGPRAYKIGSKKQLGEASCRAVKNTFFVLAILKKTLSHVGTKIL